MSGGLRGAAFWVRDCFEGVGKCRGRGEGDGSFQLLYCSSYIVGGCVGGVPGHCAFRVCE